jgi:hypothetical protein
LFKSAFVIYCADIAKKKAKVRKGSGKKPVFAKVIIKIKTFILKPKANKIETFWIFRYIRKNKYNFFF